MRGNKNGFTLLEIMVVIIVIGILAMLGWSSMNDLIQTNKAKESSRTLAEFAERAITEGKMRKDSVFIRVRDNSIEARFGNRNADTPDLSQSLASGFTANTTTTDNCSKNFNSTAKSEIRIGSSGIESGCFVVCNPGGTYCGGAVKTDSKNTFTALIKKKNSTTWEPL
jgi:prepilin-type N-terminal cleavage/methylation domain-containing protein